MTIAILYRHRLTIHAIQILSEWLVFTRQEFSHGLWPLTSPVVLSQERASGAPTNDVAQEVMIHDVLLDRDVCWVWL